VRDASPDLRRGAWIAIVAIAAGIIRVSAGVANRQDGDDGLAALVQRVSDAGAPGVLLFVRDGNASRTEVRCVADEEPSRPIRSFDSFRVGSVTKPYVAVLVLQLVAEGRVRLDDMVEEWVPRLVPGGSEITVPELEVAVSELEVAAFCEGP
jgi:D-alanyl-D-alanine carboxypeptidase